MDNLQGAIPKEKRLCLTPTVIKFLLITALQIWEEMGI